MRRKKEAKDVTLIMEIRENLRTHVIGRLPRLQTRRPTGRLTDRLTDRQTDRQVDRQTNTHIHGQTDK